MFIVRNRYKQMSTPEASLQNRNSEQDAFKLPFVINNPEFLSQPPEVDLIIQDHDDHLKSTSPSWFPAHIDGLRQYGYETHNDQIRTEFNGHPDFSKNLTLTPNEAGEQPDPGDVFAVISNLAVKGILAERIPEGIVDASWRIQKFGHIPQAVASSSPREVLNKSLEQDLPGLYVMKISKDDIPEGKTKPHPDSLFMITDKLHIDPAKAIMCGDSIKDVLAGKAAGMITVRTVHDFWKDEPEEDYLQGDPDFIVAHEDFDQFMYWLIKDKLIDATHLGNGLRQASFSPTQARLATNDSGSEDSDVGSAGLADWLLGEADRDEIPTEMVRIPKR